MMVGIVSCQIIKWLSNVCDVASIDMQIILLVWLWASRRANSIGNEVVYEIDGST